MSSRPVEWVLLVRYLESTHKATYGRFAGTTYTKDYLQLSRRPDFIKDLEAAFPGLSTTTHLPLRYEWPNGSASGTLVKKSADRPHLAWGTANRAPPPWRMTTAPNAATAETIRGDPSHKTDSAADREFHRLVTSGFGQPFLAAVKLRGEDNTLHLSVLIEGPEHQFEWADLRSSPPEIQELAARTSPQSALAWRYFADKNGLTGLHFDPSRKVDPWSISSAASNDAQERTKSTEARGEPEQSDLDSDLLAEGLAHSEYEVSEFERRIASGNYEVPDTFGTKKTRGSAQRAFAAEVKKNYGWRCALTGIQTRSFLIASHIVPWSVDEKIRLDPCNGICLSVLVDRAFENGILVVKDDLTVTLNSEEVGEDVELMKQLGIYDGMKLDLPKAHPPKVEYLRRRRSL